MFAVRFVSKIIWRLAIVLLVFAVGYSAGVQAAQVQPEVVTYR